MYSFIHNMSTKFDCPVQNDSNSKKSKIDLITVSFPVFHSNFKFQLHLCSRAKIIF